MCLSVSLMYKELLFSDKTWLQKTLFSSKR